MSMVWGGVMTHVSIYMIFGMITVFGVSSVFIDYPERMVAYLKHMWLYFLFITVTIAISPNIGVIVLALISFMGMREYFTLTTIRPQDRLGVWGAFLTIPCMALALWMNWYHPFVVFMLLYSFLGISYLVVLGGGTSDGTVFSIGVIVFGILLFVVGNGHVGFLTIGSAWLTVLVIVAISLVDSIAFFLSISLKWPIFEGYVTKYLISLPATVAIFLVFTPEIYLSRLGAVVIGASVPILVAAIRYIMIHVEKDLGIAADYETLRRGRLINSSSPLIMTVPLIFQFQSIFVQ